MAQMTTLNAVKMTRSDPDAIVAAGELVDLRFVSGNALSLRAAKAAHIRNQGRSCPMSNANPIA